MSSIQEKPKKASKKDVKNLERFAEEIKTTDTSKRIEQENKKNADSIKACAKVNDIGKHKYQKRMNGFTMCDCGRCIDFDPRIEKDFKEKQKQIEKEQKKAEKEAKKKANKKESEEVDTWVKSLNFDELYKIKGSRGLFCICTPINKAGMAYFQKFLEKDVKIWKNQKNFYRLSSLRFYLNNGEQIGMNQVFENIERNASYFEHKLNSIDEKDLEIIVPNYDPEKFKDYHAEKVLDWFKEVKEKMIAYVEEGEKEIEAEEAETETEKED